jgi:hypothetical protein
MIHLWTTRGSLAADNVTFPDEDEGMEISCRT